METKKKRGFGSPNYDKKRAKEIHSLGGKKSKGGGRKPKANA